MSERAAILSGTQATPASAAGDVLLVPDLIKQNNNEKGLQRLPLQLKLAIGAADDPLEHEADAMADKVMRMPEASFIQRKCAHCEEDEKVHLKPLSATATPFIQAKGGGEGTASNAVTSQIDATRGTGSNMDNSTKSFMESRFGADFSDVKIHTGHYAVQMSQELNAQAFTVGSDIYFNQGKYNTSSYTGKQLLAHELTHTVQQNTDRVRTKVIQRAALTSPRLIGNPLFNDVLNNRAVIERGDHGSEVRRIQQLLVDLGFNLSASGTDGDFGTETENAVKAFQSSRTPPLTADGRVGFSTISAFDRAFPAFTLPANRANPWTMPCVLDILCPWNKNLVVSVLPTLNIITFNSRSFPTETWDGTTWVGGTFNSGGFTSGRNMGFLNSVTCQEMAFTIYHEGWHAQQPASLTGVVDTEKDAYINTEQWSINMGVPGQGTFTNNATGGTESFRATRAGETVVNEPAAERFVRQEYGGVSSTPGERVLRRIGAIQVEVMRPNGTTYTRNANPGESVRGAVSMPGQATINPASWTCP